GPGRVRADVERDVATAEGHGVVGDAADRAPQGCDGDAAVAGHLLDMADEPLEDRRRAVFDVAAEDERARAPGEREVARALDLDVRLARGGRGERPGTGEERRDVALDVA